jgi:hypothetical protein
LDLPESSAKFVVPFLAVVRGRLSEVMGVRPHLDKDSKVCAGDRASGEASRESCRRLQVYALGRVRRLLPTSSVLSVMVDAEQPLLLKVGLRALYLRRVADFADPAVQLTAWLRDVSGTWPGDMEVQRAVLSVACVLLRLHSAKIWPPGPTGRTQRRAGQPSLEDLDGAGEGERL